MSIWRGRARGRARRSGRRASGADRCGHDTLLRCEARQADHSPRRGSCVSAPVRVDNITLSDATDFDGFVLEVLRGRGGVGSLRSDNAPVDWIFRAYDQLKGTPYAD